LGRNQHFILWGGLWGGRLQGSRDSLLLVVVELKLRLSQFNLLFSLRQLSLSLVQFIFLLLQRKVAKVKRSLVFTF